MLGRPGLNTAAGSELQFLLCSCDELSSVDTAHPLCLAASHSHHMDIVLLYRNVAGSKGFGGGRHRIDNWPKLLHHAGFLLENGQNMHGRHIADARLHYQIISVLPYHHTDTTQLAKMQKSLFPRIVTAAHLHDDLQYWNLFLVPLWCGCWVASWRGCVVLKHSPVCHNPFITITDTAAAAAIITTIYFILTVRWNTPEICVQFDVFYGFYFV